MIRPENWKPVGGLTLEPNAQKAATEQHLSLALTAGPGAGKTEMLAQRADFLLQTGISPYPKRILAISFKVDASTNLKERVQKRCGADMASRLDSYTFHGFSKRIIDIFRPVLSGLDSLDSDYTIGEVRLDKKQITFADMIPMAIDILSKCNVARKALHEAYSDVFLDEFQDCTNDQYELLKLAFFDSGVRMVAVGDTKQRIMSWAGALEGVFAQYVNDFNATPLTLFRNFRSKGTLLRLQNKIIADLDPNSVMDEELIPDNEGTILVKNFATCADEADYVGQAVADWIEMGIPISEIAILVRNQVGLYTEKIVDILDDLGISTRNEQDLQDVVSEPIVGFILDFLLVLFGDKEPDSWTRLHNVFYTLFFSSNYDDSSHAFTDYLNKVSLRVRDRVNNAHSFDEIWAYVEGLLNQIDPSRWPLLSVDYEKADRIKELIALARETIKDAFLANTEIVAAIKSLDEVHAVRLLTVHKSKGLEFEAVIMLGIENEAYFGDPNESLCTFFVGVSRAKRHLILTHCDHRDRPDQPLKFWKELRSEQSEYLSYANQIINS